MSDEITKEKRSKRLYHDKTKSMRQKKILKSYGADFEPFESPNYYNKRHALNCGNPNCVMCGNPRKFLDLKTIQEYKFDEYEKSFEE